MLDADASEKPVDRNVEKEVAAALESVFPRVGLTSFVNMPAEDKRFQLEELMHIVEGIRLFNKELGKGGSGIPVMVGFIQENVATLAKMIKDEIKECNEVCSQYTEVLLHMHYKNFPDDQASPEIAIIQRWQDELSNRRQFLSYLQSLEEDISFALEKMTAMLSRFKSNLNALKNLVGARMSLPKSQVYPLFEAVSRSWKELLQEHGLLQQVEIFAAEDTLNGKAMTSMPTFRVKGQFGGDHDDDADDNLDPNDEEDAGFPIRMPVDSTPESMQLPLEYQDFCPWTIVERGGLLLPGDPLLGVVQYRNAYHVSVNERALGEFMTHPRRYVQGILKLAAKQPSLIYLLRLQENFPNINLSALLKLCLRSRPGNFASSVHPLLAPPASQKVDASTSTPTHFVEKNIDYNYDWNEWNLRRKAIKVANLRHCKTVSCQATLSNFRHEVDTQVYLPAENSSQTGRECGTNPARMVTYFAGLRSGKVLTGDHGDDGKQENEDEDALEDLKHAEGNQPAIISYTYEL